MAIKGTREERNAYARDYARLMYRMRKNSGLCVICGGEIDDKGTNLRCAKCERKYREHTNRPEIKTKRNEHVKRRRDLLVAFGVCVNCGHRDAVKGYQKCLECRAEGIARSTEYRRRNGIPPKIPYGDGIHCIRCKKPVMEGRKLCPEHYRKSVEALAYGREVRKNSEAWEHHPWKARI